MSSKGFTFNQPVVLGANSLDRMSFDDFFDMGELEGSLPSFPPKTIKQIIELVRAGRTNTIHIFEWLDAIENQNQWNNLDVSEKQMACIAVWTGIGSHSTLGDIAMFKLGLSLDDKPSSVVADLVDSIEIARTVPNWNEFDALKLDWLLALKSQQYQSMVEMCYQVNRSVASYIKLLRLPQASSYQRLVEQKILNVIPKTDLSTNDDLWLISNFYALKTTQQRVQFCSNLISHLAMFSFGEQCHDVIEQHCLPNTSDSFWTSLTQSERSILKKKFNLTGYFDLYAISSALYSDHAESELGLTEYEVRQIRSRSKFWSNYSTRFDRVRVLLPETSYHFVDSHNGGVPDYVTKISGRDTEVIEVYVFEIEDIIVVEFLRGELGETRIFKNNDWHAKQLFDSSDLTIADIRAMTQLDVHDHLACWQFFCEKLLRTKFQIIPNKDTTKFKGLSRELGLFNVESGLPKPSLEHLDTRKKHLEVWVENFWKIENATGKFGEAKGLSERSNIHLSRALMAKQLGDNDEYERFIRKAADQGNPEAMYLTGISILRNNRSDRKLKQSAEEWIVRAAKNGHLSAIEFAQKFRLDMGIASTHTLDREQIVQKKQVSPSKPLVNDVLDKDAAVQTRIQCLQLINRDAESEHQKALDLAKELYKTDQDLEAIQEGMYSLLNRTRVLRIRNQVIGMLRSRGDEKLQLKLARSLSQSMPSEQIVALTIFDEIFSEYGTDTTKDIESIVSKAREASPTKVEIYGLALLDKQVDKNK
ncbi:hypothetical protein ACER1F_001885 [Vibrio alginolyticus]|uniref:EH signature domain-containing protein n=1 Tax=Vibrio TaxID=662 RepID=UPI0015F4E86F|nr:MULTISPECIES: EH signature domain-containing protein [Vibrio]USD73173.1 hypothetical protein J4N43_10135 [Vibrio sp. SCSIO 43009]